jgi:hypothetical protein
MTYDISGPGGAPGAAGRGLRGEFFSLPYLISTAFTLGIFLLGFKWTLLSLYWLPYVFNPFIYACVLLFWFYYNFMWLRTAMYLPSSLVLILRTYKAAGYDISLWRAFYLALCKVQKLRKEDMKLKRVDGGVVRMLSRAFMKHGIILNFRRDDAELISTSLFIHSKRKVFALLRELVPFFVPTFIVILILTPLTLFLSSFNYGYLMEKFTGVPVFMSFNIYMFMLPFRLAWIFLILNLLAVNVISPLITMPAADLYGAYLSRNGIKINADKRQTADFEGIMALLMLCASMVFYVSTILVRAELF